MCLTVNFTTHDSDIGGVSFPYCIINYDIIYISIKNYTFKYWFKSIIFVLVIIVAEGRTIKICFIG